MVNNWITWLPSLVLTVALSASAHGKVVEPNDPGNLAPVSAAIAGVERRTAHTTPVELADAGHGAKQPKMKSMASESHGRHGAKNAASAPAGHWSGPATERTLVNPVQFTREGLIQAGEIYRENCIACHGGEGHGNGPLAKDLDTQPSNLFLMAPSHADGDLRWKIAKGRGEMPGWEDVLSDEQIWTLVHYLKTFPAYQLARNPEDKN